MLDASAIVVFSLICSSSDAADAARVIKGICDSGDVMLVER